MLQTSTRPQKVHAASAAACMQRMASRHCGTARFSLACPLQAQIALVPQLR